MTSASTALSLDPAELRLSVVIVSFKSRPALAGCLESLIACRQPIPLEIVVVDNASNDGTVEMLRGTYPWVQVIANAENLGFTRGVNQGFERAQSDCVFMLNPDCVVTPEALELLLAALEAEPSLAAVAPTLLDGQGGVARSCGRFPDLWTLLCDHLRLVYLFPDSPRLARSRYGGWSMESLDRVDWASGAALLVSRRAWSEIGGLDENIFMYMEDVDWCRRAARDGRAVRYIPAARIVHFGQQSSRHMPVETYLHDLKSRVYYFRKHHGPLAALITKAILGLTLFLKWSAACVYYRGRKNARMYSAGMGAVWRASWP